METGEVAHFRLFLKRVKQKKLVPENRSIKEPGV